MTRFCWGLEIGESYSKMRTQASLYQPPVIYHPYFKFRLDKRLNEHVHMHTGVGHILISSPTPSSSRFLFDFCLAKFPGLPTRHIRYIDSRLHQHRYGRMREWLRDELRLAALVPGMVVVMEGLEMVCPGDGANEAIVEEMIYWLDGGLPSQLVFNNGCRCILFIVNR